MAPGGPSTRTSWFALLPVGNNLEQPIDLNWAWIMPNSDTRLFDSYGDDFVIATILRDVDSFGSNAESPLSTLPYTLSIVNPRLGRRTLKPGPRVKEFMKGNMLEVARRLPERAESAWSAVWKVDDEQTVFTVGKDQALGRIRHGVAQHYRWGMPKRHHAILSGKLLSLVYKYVTTQSCLT